MGLSGAGVCATVSLLFCAMMSDSVEHNEKWRQRVCSSYFYGQFSPYNGEYGFHG
jgi:hypothetical protein